MITESQRNQPSRVRFGRGVVLGGCAIAGTIAIVTRWTWSTAPAAIPDTLPMAPSTAGVILLLAVAFVLRELGSGAWLARRIPAVIATVVAGAAGLVVLRVLGVLGSGWEARLAHTHATFDSIPIGLMSALTAVVLLVLAGSLLAGCSLRAPPRWVRRGFLAGTACAAGLSGIIASAYVAGVPLFYRPGFVPMAWSSALALLALSAAALVAISERESLGLRFQGIHARLFAGFGTIVGLMVFLFAMAFQGLAGIRNAAGISGRENSAVFMILFLSVGTLSVAGTLTLGYYLDRALRLYHRERDRAEAELEHASAYNRSLIEASLDPLVTIGADGKITDVNAATETATGLGRVELVGTDFSDYFTEPEKARTGYQQVFRDGYVRDYPLELRHRDGHLRTVLYNASVYRDDRGEVRGVFAAARDITEARRAEAALAESERSFRTLAESVPQIVWATRPDGWNTYFNQHWVDYTGLTLEESRGHGWNIPFHPDDQKRAWDAWQEATQHGTPYALEVRLRRVDGVYRWWLVRGAPLLDAAGKTIRWFGTCTDIDDLKQAEMEIRQLNASLEQRVAERTRELHRRMAELRTIFETAPVGLAIADGAEGRTIHGNPMIEQLTGVAREKELSLSADVRPAYRALDSADRELPVSELPMQRACSGEVVSDCLMKIVRPDGRVSILHSNATPLRDENGDVRGAVGAFMDVTELKRAEAELARTSRVLAEGQRIAHLGSFEYDAATRGTVWSDEEFRIYGLDPGGTSPSYDDLLAHHIHPEDAPRLQRTFMGAVQGGTIYELEHRIVRPDGTVRWVYNRAQPYFDPGGALLRYVGVTLDITDRKQADAALRESEELRRAVMDSSPDAIYVKDRQSRWLLGNPEVLRIVGRTAEQALGKTDLELYANPAIGRAILENDQQVFATGRTGTFEELAETPEGHRVFQSIKAPRRDAEGMVIGLIGISRDITEQKKAETALRESEARLAAVMENLPVGIWVVDAKGQVTAKNHAADVIWRGDAPLSERPEDYADYITFDVETGKRLAVDDYPLARTLRTGLPVSPVELRIRRFDGTDGFIMISTAPLRGPGGTLTGAVGINLDITEQKLADEALRRSEEKFKVIASCTPDHLLVQDRDLRYTFVLNPQLGLSEKEMLGRTDHDFLNREDADRITAIKRQVLETGRAIRLESPLLSSTGETEYFEGSYVPRFDAEGRVDGLIGYFHNVTERKRTEERIQRLNAELQSQAAGLAAANQELEAFAYSVSHDLRAPLRAIDGFGRILLRDQAPLLDEPGRDNLHRIRAATQRMATLIDDLLQLSRTARAGFNRVALDLAPVARAIAAELDAVEPSRRVTWQIAATLPAHGDAALLRIALENLLGNAWKFTGRRDDARIEFGTMERDDGPAFFVRDNGVGFDMRYAGKLFGAFQRLHTSEEFPGTGIGLATVQRIIHRHGGRVWAEGETGAGASFYFTLPGGGPDS